MKKFKKLFKPKYILSVGLISVICVGITLSLFQSKTGTLTNTFSAGEVTTNIEEDTKVTNSTIKKEPKVYNDGPNDCLVRVRVTISPSELENLIKEENDVNFYYCYQDSTNNTQKMNGFNTINWEYADDGFWYYQGILTVEQTTEPLFSGLDGLIADGKIKTEYQDLFNDFQITIYQESVQAIVYDQDGDHISAYENFDNASQIWQLYDEGIIDISEMNKNN